MNNKYWLIGGITGSLLVILNVVLIGPFGPLRYLLAIPINLLEKVYFLSSSPPGSVLLVGYVLTGFICGAMVGFIYGKVKNRNKLVE